MRLFANLFLMLFVVDGGISLFDEIASGIYPVPALSELRNLVANSVILLAVPLYLSLGVDSRLPKRVFLPLILFLFCPYVSFRVLPAVAATPAWGLLMATGQMLLCILLLSRFRKMGQQGLAMPKAMFDAPFFSLKNSMIFGAANIVIVPCALALSLFCMANSFMTEYTPGFMRLAPDGLRMTEKVYQRGKTTIRLAGMIHVGEKNYYDELFGSVAPGRTIVLAEGVTDDKNLLRNRLDYGKVAGFLGLVSQEKMHFRGRRIDEDAFEKLPSRSGSKGEIGTAGPADIFRADVDISTFRPSTIRFIDELGKQLMGNASLVKGFLSFNAWAEKNMTPEMNRIIMEDILYRRNTKVIHHLRKAVDRYDTVVIPWGALHMAEIEAEVVKQGFQLQQERERVSIDFRKLLRGKL